LHFGTSFFGHLTVHTLKIQQGLFKKLFFFETFLLFIFLPLNKEVEAETGTLVCKQTQDNTTVPHSRLVVDKQ